jgi:SAM-dependent methyltransferase
MRLTWEQAVQSVRADPRQRALVRDAYYDDPLSAAAARYADSEEWRAIAGYLPARRGRALDVGAGRGIASYALARSGYEVDALEPDPSPLVGADAIEGLARQTGLPIRVVREFSERLPFPDAAYDVVFARAVLHHTRDLPAACREFHRVLKPGGVFLAVREHVISRREDLAAFFAIHPMHHLYGGENAFLREEYLAALTGAGFAIEHELQPLRSPINYAPHTRESLGDEFAARARRVPGAAPLVRGLMRTELGFDLVTRLAALVDDRPGRLYSFVCRRPD